MFSAFTFRYFPRIRTPWRMPPWLVYNPRPGDIPPEVTIPVGPDPPTRVMPQANLQPSTARIWSVVWVENFMRRHPGRQ